jgi:hypothetical protein
MDSISPLHTNDHPQCGRCGTPHSPSRLRRRKSDDAPMCSTCWQHVLNESPLQWTDIQRKAWRSIVGTNPVFGRRCFVCQQDPAIDRPGAILVPTLGEVRLCGADRWVMPLLKAVDLEIAQFEAARHRGRHGQAPQQDAPTRTPQRRNADRDRQIFDLYKQNRSRKQIISDLRLDIGLDRVKQIIREQQDQEGKKG